MNATAPTRRPLKVGIQLPEVEREVRWPELLDMIRAIEDLGFDSIWLGEHLLYRFPDREARGPWEAWTMLGAVAGLVSAEGVAVGGFEAVAVSYPGFARDLAAIGGVPA